MCACNVRGVEGPGLLPGAQKLKESSARREVKLVVYLVLLNRVRREIVVHLFPVQETTLPVEKVAAKTDASRSSKPAVRGAVLSETDVNVGGPLSLTTRRQVKNHRSSERKKRAGRKETTTVTSTRRQQRVAQQLRL